MNHFIFPVIIESRKILFLDLLPMGRNADVKNVGEDEYIVKLPDLHEKAILSISKNRLIQSLHPQVEDINLKDVHFSFQYDEQTPCLKITASVNTAKTPYPHLELFEGLFLRIDDEEDAIELKISKANHFEALKQDHLYIQFLLSADSGNVVYAASLKLYIADKKQVLYAGFDFGSEASQMCEGDYRDSGNDLRQKDVNLFTDVKQRLGGASNDDDYMQYESRRLYKSVFYAKKNFRDDTYDPGNTNGRWKLPSSAINGLTLKKETGPHFFDEWFQIPNLKLLYDNPSIASAIAFNLSANGKQYPVDLNNIRNNLYASLLKEILLSYLSKRIFSNVYLRFTLLVPNIYSIDEILETKKIIRSIVLDSTNAFHKFIKGLEVSSLSESDAAFLGCLSTFPVEKGSYYIIIDCGKGTTDFSIIQFEGTDTFRSVYRNGFAGAGNLITFGVLQSVFHYLKQTQQGNAQMTNLEAFKDTHLSKGSQNWGKLELSVLAEKWKKLYDGSLPLATVEKEWHSAKSGDLDLAGLFTRYREGAEVFSFLNKIDHVHDWGGYIDKAINKIIEKIHVDLSQISNHLKSNCGGILLTGRGFLFKPLEQATKTIIRSIKGMEDVRFIDTRGKNLKEICLDGVFVRNILTYNDVASTPIEINIRTQRQYLNRDLASGGFIKWLKRQVNKLADMEGEYYDEDLNSCKVLNLNFAECQFLVGNKSYEPENKRDKDIAEAFLLQSRRGLFIKGITGNGKKIIIPLINIVRRDEGDQLMIEKSLFPGWYDPHLLES